MALAPSLALSNWTRLSAQCYLSSQPYTESVYTWENTSGQVQHIFGGGFEYKPQQITGDDPSNGPAWSAPFTPLTTQELQTGWSFDVYLDPGAGYSHNIHWTVEDGQEGFYTFRPYWQVVFTERLCYQYDSQNGVIYDLEP